MRYSEMMHDFPSELIVREEIEWSNFWYDQANSDADGRILLIGDSTARMIRSTYARESGKPVDLFATSSNPYDPLFIAQLDCFFSSARFRYDTIIVQVGHHGDVGVSEKAFHAFRESCSVLIDFLLQFTDNILIESLFYSVKPRKYWKIAKLLHLKETYDSAANEIRDAKNRIWEKIAQEKGLKYLDINGFMLENGKQFYHQDHIHFENAAKKFIVDEMMRALACR